MRSILQKLHRHGILPFQRLHSPSLQYQATASARPLSAIANRCLPRTSNSGKKLRSESVRFSSSAVQHNFVSLQQGCLASDVKIMAANVVNNVVDVKWNDGNKSLYPLIYLRDICSCPSCCHPEFQQRISDVVVTCKLDYGSTAVNLTQDGKMLKVNWSDGHISR